jgi:disulfide bond formation protein DsbB
MQNLPIINSIFSTATLAAHLGLLILGLAYIFFRPKTEALFKFLEANKFMLSFIVALTATASSLIYSEVIGLPPCILCWYQRIFMYPLVTILLIAIAKKDTRISPYILSLAVGGGLIALYHYLLQIGAAPAFSCSAVGYSVNCADTFRMSYGYITLPMMALTAFTVIAGLMLVPTRRS